MSLESELSGLKAALTTEHPNLAGVFTDEELTGMLWESHNEICPGCSVEDHIKTALLYARRVAEEQELGI